MEYFKAKYASRASRILHVLAAGGVRLFSFLGQVYDGAAGEEPLSLELDPFSLSCGSLKTRDFPRDARFLCLIWAAENWSRGQLSCARAPRRRSLPPPSRPAGSIEAGSQPRSFRRARAFSCAACCTRRFWATSGEARQEWLVDGPPRSAPRRIAPRRARPGGPGDVGRFWWRAPDWRRRLCFRHWNFFFSMSRWWGLVLGKIGRPRVLASPSPPPYARGRAPAVLRPRPRTRPAKRPSCLRNLGRCTRLWIKVCTRGLARRLSKLTWPSKAAKGATRSMRRRSVRLRFRGSSTKSSAMHAAPAQTDGRPPRWPLCRRSE